MNWDWKSLRAAVVNKTPGDIQPVLEKRGCRVVTDHPDLVIAYGGDGTLLRAEREYPGVPKLPIRDARTAMTCTDHTLPQILDRFEAGELSETVLPKLEGRIGERRILALNDLFIHNSNPILALRYQVWIGRELYATEIVGDAVGLATVHGSTAYYQSITHSIFRVGLGLAFSNSTEEVNHLVLPEDAVVRIHVVRGPAMLIADNDPGVIPIPEDGDATLRKAPETTTIYGLNGFMCPKCRMLRHPNHHPFKNFLPR